MIDSVDVVVQHVHGCYDRIGMQLLGCKECSTHHNGSNGSLVALSPKQGHSRTVQDC